MNNQQQLAAPGHFTPTHFDSRLDEIRKILPPNTITGDALVRVVLTALNKNSKLRECSMDSILGCLMDIASLGLMPNTPHQHAWIIPYYNTDLQLRQAQLQIGYKGFAELAYRSGEVKMIKGDVVREGDDFDYQKGSGIQEYVRHKKSLKRGRKDQPVVAAWNSVELLSGGLSIEVMEAEELDKIEAISTRNQKNNQPTPAWKYFRDEMLKKTVVRRNLKLLQIGNMDTIQRAVKIDERVSGFIMPEADSPFAALPSNEHKIEFRDTEDKEAPANTQKPEVENLAEESDKW